MEVEEGVRITFVEKHKEEISKDFRKINLGFQTEDEHIVNIDKNLENHVKEKFYLKELKHLGYKINLYGMAMYPDRVKIIKEYL